MGVCSDLDGDAVVAALALPGDGTRHLTAAAQLQAVQQQR